MSFHSFTLFDTLASSSASTLAIGKASSPSILVWHALSTVLPKGSFSEAVRQDDHKRCRVLFALIRRSFDEEFSANDALYIKVLPTSAGMSGAHVPDSAEIFVCMLPYDNTCCGWVLATSKVDIIE